MRDLDQLQERDPREEQRRLGSILMAALAFVGMSAAVGVVVGRAARPAENSPAKDPLSDLEQTATLRQQVQAEAPEVPEVKPTSMSFPSTLSGEEERPEVLAALAAAAQEEARIAGVSVAELGAATAPAPSRIGSASPMATAASSTQEALRRGTAQNPLLAATLPQANVDPTLMAPRGEEGEFSLHVMSYEDEADANTFVDALRSRGHSAFVAAADVPERGRYYRVRIGPFDSQWRAELYRKKFAQTEQLNTIVVKRPEEE